MIEQLKVSLPMDRTEVIAAFGPKIEFDKSLASLSSFGTGGRASYFLDAQSADDIRQAVAVARRLRIPFFVIGGGSNLLISDDGYRGLIIRIHVKGMGITGDAEITCGAGEQLMDLVSFAADRSLTGLEFASGIWGTVGGAIYGNAGAYGGEMKDVITGVTLVTKDGEIKSVPAAYCQFSYRDSYFKKSGDIIVSARLSLHFGERETIQARIAEILTMRASKHPTEGGTAGCFFKNIPDPTQKFGKLPAGKLLEEIGAKTMSVGGAAVYPKHANIIVNTGSATSKDIRQLADILKRKVFEKYGILLDEEVVQIGDF